MVLNSNVNTEIWNSIKGYDGLYEVSNFGKVRSVKHGIKEKVLQKKKHGYYDIELFSNGISKRYLIHRLVAQAFIKNPNNYTQINHKDENKANNHMNNLEWCTPKYNQRYSHGRIVLQLDVNGNLVKEWGSLRETEEFGFNHGAIYRCCNNIDKLHKGYRWKYGKI